jgi:hypothetical protein
MKAYREPSYQDRMGRAAKAKQKALDLLEAKPVPDEATLAVRRAAALGRDAARAEKRAARKAVDDRAAAEEAIRVEEQEAAPTQEERKAARDARYAARKSRK